MTNKPLSSDEFQHIAEEQLKDPSLALHGKDVKTVAKIRATHYANGAELLKQISDTLTMLAVEQNDPDVKQQAKLAISRINDAQNAFSNASLCQGTVHGWGTGQGNPKEIPVNLKSS
jgi:hypothetical protein